MACRIFDPRLLVFFGLLAPGLMLGQPEEEVSARNILKQSTADQIAFLEATIDRGFPEDRLDHVTMLVINRSDIAVPILLRNAEDALNSQTAPARIVDMSVELITYAGDEQAIQAIARLISIDEKRFGRYVGRALDDAANWRNPVSVAYRALELSDSRITGLVMTWVEAGMESSGMQRKWAEAMLDRYGKVPTPSDWAQDPIGSRLKTNRAFEVRNRVFSAASEVQRQRQRN